MFVLIFSWLKLDLSTFIKETLILVIIICSVAVSNYFRNIIKILFIVPGIEARLDLLSVVISTLISMSRFMSLWELTWNKWGDISGNSR